MSYSPIYLVPFQSSSSVTREQIRNALEGPSTEVTEDSDGAYQVQDTLCGAEGRVYYDFGWHVPQESWEIAEKFGDGRRDKEFIAACDQRFEVIAAADEEMLYFNNWLIAAERLQELVHGVVFDPADGTFVG